MGRSVVAAEEFRIGTVGVGESLPLPPALFLYRVRKLLKTRQMAKSSYCICRTRVRRVLETKKLWEEQIVRWGFVQYGKGMDVSLRRDEDAGLSEWAAACKDANPLCRPYENYTVN